MTPADYGAEAEGDGDAVSEESSSESSDGEPLSLDAYDPDPGQVQKLRPTGNEGKKQVCWLWCLAETVPGSYFYNTYLGSGLRLQLLTTRSLFQARFRVTNQKSRCFDSIS